MDMEYIKEIAPNVNNVLTKLGVLDGDVLSFMAPKG
jgi:hypothetical protein